MAIVAMTRDGAYEQTYIARPGSLSGARFVLSHPNNTSGPLAVGMERLIPTDAQPIMHTLLNLGMWDVLTPWKQLG